MPILISCPSCSKQLRVPDDLLGQSVRCPACQKTFTATAANEPPPSEPTESAPSRMQMDEPEAEPRRPRAEEREDDEDYPRRSRPSSSRGDYAPARGGLVMGLGIGSVVTGALSILANGCLCLPVVNYVAMPATVILAILAVALGIPALIMGNRDKASIRAGKMDPAGEGQTKAGWVCGLIGLILGALEMVCLAGFCLLAIFGVAMFKMSNPH